MNNLIDGDLCRLIHDLQGHIVYTSDPETGKKSVPNTGNFLVSSKWSHSSCCGSFHPYYIVHLAQSGPDGMSFVFWTQNLGEYSAHGYMVPSTSWTALRTVFKEKMGLIKLEGIMGLHYKPYSGWNFQTGTEPVTVKLYDGCIGRFKHPSGEMKNIKRVHSRLYATPISVVLDKEYMINIYGTTVPSLPSWEVWDDMSAYDHGESFENWMHNSMDDYQDGVSAKLSKYANSSKEQYNNKDLLPLNFTKIPLQHQFLDCDICKELTPLFKESEAGAVRILKSVGIK